jgi:hypothetical protein
MSDGTKPKKTAPKLIRQGSPSSTYCHSSTDNVYLLLVQYATDRKRETGEPFPFEAACVSLMLDRHFNNEKGKADYRRIWGWSEQQLRSRWGEINAVLGDWKSLFGRSKTGESANVTATDEQRIHNANGLDSTTNSHDDNVTATDEQRIGNGLTTSSSSASTSQSGEGSAAVDFSNGETPTGNGSPLEVIRTGDGSVTPGLHKPSNIDDVRGHAAIIGVGRESADKFYWHFEAKGWKDIVNWKAMLQRWKIDDQTRKTNTTNPPRFTSGGGAFI